MSLFNISERLHGLLTKNPDCKLNELLNATTKEKTLEIYETIAVEVRIDLKFIIQQWINRVFSAIVSYNDIINNVEKLVEATKRFDFILVWIYDNMDDISRMRMLAFHLHDESKKMPLSLICIPKTLVLLQETSFKFFEDLE